MSNYARNKKLKRKAAILRISEEREVSLVVAANIYNCMSCDDQKRLRSREKEE